MQDEIDRILADDERIDPSSGFVAGVMEAVRSEAESPAPIKFPWLRALPGFAALITALGASAWKAIDSLGDPAARAAFEGELGQLSAMAASIGLPWIVLAAALTWFAVALPAGWPGFDRGRNR